MDDLVYGGSVLFHDPVGSEKKTIPVSLNSTYRYVDVVRLLDLEDHICLRGCLQPPQKDEAGEGELLPDHQAPRERQENKRLRRTLVRPA